MHTQTQQQSFFNTTNETGEILLKNIAKANNQEKEVLHVFSSKTGGSASPSMVCRNLNDKYPITSIRRAITNLTSKGYLRKTAVKVLGSYGRPEYVWKLTK